VDRLSGSRQAATAANDAQTAAWQRDPRVVRSSSHRVGALPPGVADPKGQLVDLWRRFTRRQKLVHPGRRPLARPSRTRCCSPSPVVVLRFREQLVPQLVLKDLPAGVAGQVRDDSDPRSDHRAWQSLLARAGVRRARLHDALDTQRRRCSSPRECLHGSLWRSWGTPKFHSRWAPTATSLPSWLKRRHGGRRPPCGADGNHAGTVETGRTGDQTRVPSSVGVGRPGIEPGTRGLKADRDR